MDKLRIKNDDLYRIEVNDDGEYIEFDLKDVSLTFRCYEAIDKIEELTKKALEKERELLEQILKENVDDFETDAKKEYAKFKHDTCMKMREIMDGFLGKNACQKIFRDYNDFDMFDLLFEEFNKPREELDGQSYFDKIQVKSGNLEKRLMEKYNKNKKAVI